MQHQHASANLHAGTRTRNPALAHSAVGTAAPRRRAVCRANWRNAFPCTTISRYRNCWPDSMSVSRNKERSSAAAVLLDADTLQPLASHIARVATSMPYVPGLLSFRELPALVAALAMLTRTPDLVFVDGQGIAHPRRLGSDDCSLSCRGGSSNSSRRGRRSHRRRSRVRRCHASQRRTQQSIPFARVEPCIFLCDPAANLRRPV